MTKKNQDPEDSDTEKSLNDIHEKVNLTRYLETEAKHQTDHGERCQILLSMSASDRMKQIVVWGDGKGIPRKDSNHTDYCLECGKGEGAGELYLCEFCENVVHQKCIGFMDDLDDIDFVCDECMIDLLMALEMW
jgi:hypothetical protein